jgi:hypothetical protein
MHILLLLLISAGLVLTYGYWHARTHGALNLALYDASQENSFSALKEAKLELRDGEGTLLATGKTDSTYGTVYLSRPGQGFCYEQERQATQSKNGMNAWQVCFRAQSTWLMEWVRQTRLGFENYLI